MPTPVDIVMPTSYTLVRKEGTDQLMRKDGGAHPELKGPYVVSASCSGCRKRQNYGTITGIHKVCDGANLLNSTGGGGR